MRPVMRRLGFASLAVRSLAMPDAPNGSPGRNKSSAVVCVPRGGAPGSARPGLLVGREPAAGQDIACSDAFLYVSQLSDLRANLRNRPQRHNDAMRTETRQRWRALPRRSCSTRGHVLPRTNGCVVAAVGRSYASHSACASQSDRMQARLTGATRGPAHPTSRGTSCRARDW